MANDKRRSSGRPWIRAVALALLVVLLVVLLGAGAYYTHAGWYRRGIFHDLPSAAAGLDRPAIVMLSGDMGDRVGMTPKVAARLHARGYAVVTVNSLAYFSPRRTATERTSAFSIGASSTYSPSA